MTSPVLGALSGLLVAAAAVTVPSAALAANVTLTGWAHGGGATVQASGSAVPTGAYNGWAGGFGGTLAGAGALDALNFVTWCVELEEHFSFSGNAMTGYRVMDAADYFGDRAVQNPLRPNGAQVAERLGQLISWMNADATRVDTAAESVAMQLAIWNIVYDTDWTVTASSAFRDASTHKTAATQMLQGAMNTAGNVRVFVLAKAGSQDFITWQRVPEPGSLALAGLALAGLALQRGRRSSSRPTAASSR